STEAAKTAATEGGTVARIASLVAEKAQSLLTAGAAMVEAVAKFIADAVSRLGIFSLIAIPAGVAALAGLYQGAKKTFGFASGGFIGRPGERGHDTVPIVVGRGEAILNHHQQAVVDDALQRSGRGGLSQLFRDERRPHFRYNSGGFAGYAPLLSNPRSNAVRGDSEARSQNVDLGPLLVEMRETRELLAEEVDEIKRLAKPRVMTGAQARRLSRRAKREETIKRAER
ncbi:MAG: hypothetical protein AAF170_07900, partial [Bacteroidota bacterium]